MKRILKYNFDALYTFYLLNFVTNGKLQQTIETIAVAEDSQYFVSRETTESYKRSCFQDSKVKAIQSISQCPLVSNSVQCRLVKSHSLTVRLIMGNCLTSAHWPVCLAGSDRARKFIRIHQEL